MKKFYKFIDLYFGRLLFVPCDHDVTNFVSAHKRHISYIRFSHDNREWTLRCKLVWWTNP